MVDTGPHGALVLSLAVKLLLVFHVLQGVPHHVIDILDPCQGEFLLRTHHK